MWFLENFFGLDRDYAISCVCDNNNDKGIDGIYVDHNEEEIHVFQSKFKESNDTSIGDRDLRDFAGVKEWFRSSESVKELLTSTINQELKTLIQDNKLIEIVDDYEVEYHFIENAFKDHNTEEYLKVNTELTCWDLETLHKRYHYIKDDPLVIDSKIFENINKEQLIILNIDDMSRVAIMPILAQDLITLKGISDFTLFSKNVRYGLGNTRVNKAIKKTLNDPGEKDKFLLYHNGISLVCERFSYDETNNKLIVENYSIVNGAQSTLTFYNNSDLLTNDVQVLLRIIEVGNNSSLTNKISIYNNNQNSISMKDLRANDNVQRRLTREFEELKTRYSINIVYIPKKGKKVEEGFEKISSDYAAQLIAACYLKTPYNTHEKNSMFDSSYREIFNKNIDAHGINMYYNAHKILKSNIDKIVDQRIATYGLAQYFLLSVLFRIIGNNDITKIIIQNPEKYTVQRDNYNMLFNRIFEILFGIFNHYIAEYKKDPDFIYKNFFKSREKVEKLESDIIAMFNTALSINSTSYETLCHSSGITI